jgi:hypothetical protein
MYTPRTYPVALLIMLVSMLCWGSWANTEINIAGTRD